MNSFFSQFLSVHLLIYVCLFCCIELSCCHPYKDLLPYKTQKSTNVAPVLQPFCENHDNDGCPKWIDSSLSEIEAAMKCYPHPPPGFVITIVYNSNDSLVKSFGYSTMDSPKKAVKLDTKFAIGSLSKAFTSTLIGILLSEQKERYPKSWETKIIDVMGKNYSLTDELRTKQSTILDILAHRVALHAYDFFLQTALDPKISIQDYCRRLQYVEKVGLFRSKYVYNNMMLVLATCIAEKLGNNSFSNLLKEKLFIPLGMNDTEVVSDSRINNYKNLAKMYYRNGLKEIAPLNMDILRSVETLVGAGGIVSTGRDMSKWIKFHLNHGRNDQGKPLIPFNYWADMHTRHMVVERIRRPSHVEKPTFPITNSLSSYGLGWRIGHYRGFLQSEHTGEIGSYISKITLLHNKGIGIFTITNGPAYLTGELQMATHFYLLDNLLKEKAWLNSSTICSFPRPWSNVSSSKQISRQTFVILKRNLTFLNNISNNYIGFYGHPIFGNFTIFKNITQADGPKTQLNFRIGLLGSGCLNFVNVSTAILEFTGTMRHIRLKVFATLHFLHQNNLTKQYKALIASGLGIQTPLLFKRNLPWEPLISIDRKSGCYINSSRYFLLLSFLFCHCIVFISLND